MNRIITIGWRRRMDAHADVAGSGYWLIGYWWYVDDWCSWLLDWGYRWCLLVLLVV
jgi:hypothetical protein